MPLVTPYTITEAVPLMPTDEDYPGVGAIKAAEAPFVLEARAYLRSALGAARVTEMETWEESADAEEAAMYQKLVTASSLLAYAAALPGLNLRPLPQGGVVTSTGYQANRVELLGPAELALMQAQLRARADLLIADFPPPPVPAAFEPPIVRSLR